MIECLAPRPMFVGEGGWQIAALLPPSFPPYHIPWILWVPLIWGILTILLLIVWIIMRRLSDKTLGDRLEEENRLDDEEQMKWIDEWDRKEKEKQDKKKDDKRRKK